MLQENEQAGVRYFTFPDLTAMGVDHVIGTRQGGVSPAPFASLNVSMSVGDAAENVRQNRARLGQIVGVTPEDMVTAWLVHGNDVAPVNGAHRGQRIPYHDALVTNEPEVPLFMTFADCVPIILFDPVHRAVGLIHAGWRGTAAGIVPRTVQVMHQCFQTRPQDLVLAFGPAIGRCHYEVGPEVLQAFQHLVRTPAVFEPADNGKVRLDLVATNQQQAEIVGIQRFLFARLCTACRTDLFYSHRAEQGRTGRFGVLVKLRDA